MCGGRLPLPGETVTLEWQETQQNFVLTSDPRPAGTNLAGVAGEGYLENPGPDSFQSGIGLISGWVCEAEAVEIAIETAAGEVMRLEVAAYGTERLDTAAVRKDGTVICGDTDNGFGLAVQLEPAGGGRTYGRGAGGWGRTGPGDGAGDDAGRRVSAGG